MFIKAVDIIVGDTIVDQSDARHNLYVERISVAPDSWLGFHGHNNRASTYYRPIDYVWVDRAKPDETAKVASALLAALKAMVNRWEPDTTGQDLVMWENACEVIDQAKAAGIKAD